MKFNPAFAIADRTGIFTTNDPYDRSAPIQLVVPQLMSSREYMRSIRDFPVPPDALAVWYFGQNGFMVKSSAGPLIGIDLYLSNSCASAFPDLPFRLDRQLPIFVEPEDLDIDVFLTTHSHQDHADPETIRRVGKRPGIIFVGPYDSLRIYEACGIEGRCCRLLHPGETLEAGDATVQATFALPTDRTDLNHMGVLLAFRNGITFYNTGDTAWAEGLPGLLPTNMDVCTVCMNGGFHNLGPMQAAAIVLAVHPRVAIPCHYDMMVNNVHSPEMLRVALDLLGSKAEFTTLKYYEPWVYRRPQNVTVNEVNR